MTRKRIHISKQVIEDVTEEQPPKKHRPSKDEEEESSEEDTEEDDIEEDEEDTEEDDIEEIEESDKMIKSNDIGRFLQTFNPEAHKQYTSVKTYIDNSRPNLIKILCTPFRIEDKARLFQMFEVMCSLDYPSQDYIDYHGYLTQEIDLCKRRYADYQRLTEDAKTGYEEEKTRLLSLSSSLPLDYQIIALDADDLTKSNIFKEFVRMSHLSINDDERPKLDKWINTCLAMPFRRVKQLPDNRGVFLRQMKESLDRNIYGLEKVKEQLLVFANARMSNPEMKECTLGLIGPPGIGKTMIARLVSECLTIPFAQISCGGITEAETLKGHSYTYIGSRPGEIVNALIEMKYSNGVIFFDEFEKVSKNQAITSMLLHVLDPLQNSRYQDSYLGRDISVNLSGVWFVLSMNELPEDSALRDRIFTVNLPGYSALEKFHIAKKHLIPKSFKNLKLGTDTIIIPDETIHYMIQVYSEKQSGVRGLNHSIREVITKVHFLQQSDIATSFAVKNIQTPCTVTPEMVDRIIGRPEKSRHLSMFL
jgi:ATP-dependent Lon protease